MSAFFGALVTYGLGWRLSRGKASTATAVP
jgi:hypothetical protein